MNSKTYVIVSCLAILTGFSAVDARAVPADPATGPGGEYSCEQEVIQGIAKEAGTLDRNGHPGDTAEELTEIKNRVTQLAEVNLSENYQREVRGRECFPISLENDISAEVRRIVDEEERVYSERDDKTQPNSAPLYIMDNPNNSFNGPPKYSVQCNVDAAFLCCSRH